MSAHYLKPLSRLEKCDSSVMIENQKTKFRRDIVLSVGATIIAGLLYPAFVTPIGPLSTGGIAGVTILVIASITCWLCFLSTSSQTRIMKLIKALLAIPITAMTIHEIGILLVYYSINK